MPVGLGLLAPFYQPIVLAEQLGTLAAFAQAPLLVTLANGGRSQTFDAFGLPMRSRSPGGEARRRLAHGPEHA
jgi:alkanesulfonate monooxygenase SsuD/methylene tetrahydromethanopterin reductase-like flavin-dependent oxidoreductase (luciferase family)